MLPNSLSYIFPGSRLTFFALVYALGWGGMAFVVFRLLVAVGWASVAAFVGALLVPCLQPLFNGSWEPHMEQFAPGLSLAALLAWQRRRYRWVLIFHALLGLMREDFALLFAAPLVLLGFAQYLELRDDEPELARERLLGAATVLVVSFLYVLFAFGFQRAYFPGGSVVAANYFDPAHPFAHLTSKLLGLRTEEIFKFRVGLWSPLVVLGFVAMVKRDAKLAVGAVCFLPFLTILFLAKLELNGTMATYQAFMLVVPIFWPAVVAAGEPSERWRYYGLIQVVVLCLAMMYLAIQPQHLNQMQRRWISHYVTMNRAGYEAFGSELAALHAAGPLRASHGVVSLYPYNFKAWFLVMVEDMPPSELPALRTLVWFDGDRDRKKVASVLASGTFDTTSIPGTKLKVSRRRDAEMADGGSTGVSR